MDSSDRQPSDSSESRFYAYNEARTSKRDLWHSDNQQPLLNYSDDAPDTPDIRTSIESSDRSSSKPTPATMSLPLLVVTTLGCCIVGLFANTPGAFNAYSDQFQSDTGTSDSYFAGFMGLGSATVMFSLPGGIVNDHFGPLVTLVIGAVITVFFYLSLWFSRSPGLFIIEFALVGIGSATAFIASLATAISTHNAFTIGLTSLCMSLSVTLSLFVTNEYKSQSGCKADSCWQNYMLVQAIAIGSAFVLGGILLFPFSQKFFHDKIKTCFSRRSYQTLRDDQDESRPPVSTRSDAYATASEQPTPLADESPSNQYDTVTSRGSLNTEDRTVEFDSPMGDSHDKTPATRVLTVRESLHVFKTTLFWAYMYSYTIGIAAGVLVITQTKQLWDAFHVDPSLDGFNETVVQIFSYTNASFNIICPMLSDWLESRKYLPKKTFLMGIFVLNSFFMLILGCLSASHVHSHSAQLAFAFVLGFNGAGFGTYLVLVPQIIGRSYSVENFGKYFSFIQIFTSAFSVVVPVIASSMHQAFGNFTAVYFAACFLLASAAIVIQRVAK